MEGKNQTEKQNSGYTQACWFHNVHIRKSGGSRNVAQGVAESRGHNCHFNDRTIEYRGDLWLQRRGGGGAVTAM